MDTLLLLGAQMRKRRIRDGEQLAIEHAAVCGAGGVHVEPGLPGSSIVCSNHSVRTQRPKVRK